MGRPVVRYGMQVYQQPDDECSPWEGPRPDVYQPSGPKPDFSPPPGDSSNRIVEVSFSVSEARALVREFKNRAKQLHPDLLNAYLAVATALLEKMLDDIPG